MTHSGVGISITQCESGGCLAKIPGMELISLIDNIKEITHSSSSASASTPEDAAIIELNGQSLLFTTDIGPIVGTDALIGGKIAALHAISDIYVMGGTPTHALLTLIVPKTSTYEQRQALLKGVFTACENEGVNVVGGHSIFGDNFLVGLSVIGNPNGKKILRKQNAQEGDAILISKPIGTGLAARALFMGEISEADFLEALQIMQESNKNAAKTAINIQVNALTDITGFGVIGHLSEMLRPDQGAIIDITRIPKLQVLEKIYLDGMDTIYTAANMQYARRDHSLKFNVEKAQYIPLLDPQTNGPLLASASIDKVGELEKSGFVKIGTVTSGNNIIIE